MTADTESPGVVARRLDAKVQEALAGSDVSTLHQIYAEGSIDDQRAEWARVGIG